MTEHPAARPRTRAFWADLRFLLGIALVVACVGGVALVVAAARQTVAVFASARTLVPGDAVSGDDLQVVDVALGSLEGVYLSPATLEPGMVVARTVPAGHLVPRDALVDAAAVRTPPVVVRTTTEPPAAVREGAAVEIWSAPRGERGAFDVPRILVSAATVVSVAADTSMLGGAGAAVEVVIDRASVADTLAAIAQGASLSVVPVAGAAP
ncbi:hypothetical protein [Microbacterium sp. MMO-56]|uniref:hypothetical protein n=1 Tax=Microbacterium sp. MMO-56 TaxID=3081281 RepID=UPI00301A3C2A